MSYSRAALPPTLPDKRVDCRVLTSERHPPRLRMKCDQLWDVIWRSYIRQREVTKWRWPNVYCKGFIFFFLLAGFHPFSNSASPARGSRGCWIPSQLSRGGQGGVKTWTSSRVNRTATDNAFSLSLLMHIRRNLASEIVIALICKWVFFKLKPVCKLFLETESSVT